MSNLLIVAAGLILIVLLLLALGGGIVWYLRRSQADSEATPEESTAPETAVQEAEAPAAKSPATGSPTTGPPAGAPAASPTPENGPPVRAEAARLDGSGDDFGEKIRILIVDDNPDTRGHVSRLLYFEDDLHVIGQAINGRDGIEQAIELKPHIVLMDINMPDMDGITATREMSMQAPFSQVIMMSVQAEQHYMKQAMAAGARDFQPKPFTADELISCIRRVYQIGRPMYEKIEAIEQAQAHVSAQTPVKTEQQEGDGRVIAVYSPKGGIGTSALTANLAVALQREYGDVVLMDADLQFGDILVHLNTRATRTIADLIHDGELDIELLTDVVLPHSSGLKLLLAPSRPELADAVTANMVDRVIKGLKREFKIVLVDTTSKLNDPTMMVLENADYILMVTAPELPAIKSAKQFLELTELLEFEPDRIGVVINRANLPGGISPQKIGKVLKLRHAHFVPFDPRLHVAINRGVAVTQEDGTAPSARAIADMGREIWQKLAEKEQQPVKVAA